MYLWSSVADVLINTCRVGCVNQGDTAFGHELARPKLNYSPRVLAFRVKKNCLKLNFWLWVAMGA